MTYQGHIENGHVVLNQPLLLPDGTLVRVDTFTPVTDFWKSSTLDELAKLQGLFAPRSFDDILGGWPTDEVKDKFEETFLGWRESERK